MICERPPFQELYLEQWREKNFFITTIFAKWYIDHYYAQWINYDFCNKFSFPRIFIVRSSLFVFQTKVLVEFVTFGVLFIWKLIAKPRNCWITNNEFHHDYLPANIFKNFRIFRKELEEKLVSGSFDLFIWNIIFLTMLEFLRCVYIFNDTRNTIFINQHYLWCFSSISILRLWAEFLPISELIYTLESGTIVDNRKVLLWQLEGVFFSTWYINNRLKYGWNASF